MGEQDYLAELIARQGEVLKQIDEMTRKTELTIANVMKFLGEQRDKSFERHRAMVADMERIGVVDLAPVSPVLEQLSSELQQPSK